MAHQIIDHEDFHGYKLSATNDAFIEENNDKELVDEIIN